jgi:hypothetical protein
MEAICSSEMSVDFKRTTRRYIPEDSTLHNHRCENLNCYIGLLDLWVEISWLAERLVAVQAALFSSTELVNFSLILVYSQFFWGASCKYENLRLVSIYTVHVSLHRRNEPNSVRSMPEDTNIYEDAVNMCVEGGLRLHRLISFKSGQDFATTSSLLAWTANGTIDLQTRILQTTGLLYSTSVVH